MERKPWQALLRWYRQGKRDLPWRSTKSPYRIWVSEIMLQQTRVEAVLGYYENFLNRFPHAQALADATEPELLDAWSGLGYYRRARLLQAAAKIVADRNEFPSTYAEIRALPGVGDYTAAAVASIAFDLPHAALDGNVIRVASRLSNEARDVTRPAVKRALQALVQGWMDETQPGDRGDLNQALMELGATVCTPTNPRCLACPLGAVCEARREGVQEQRPVRKAKAALERLVLTVALVRRGESLLMRQRPADETVMPGFWELPQASSPLFDPDCLAPLGIELGTKLGDFRHGITTRDYRGQLFEGILRGPREKGYLWIDAAQRGSLPLTTITKKALQSIGRF